MFYLECKSDTCVNTVYVLPCNVKVILVSIQSMFYLECKMYTCVNTAYVLP